MKGGLFDYANDEKITCLNSSFGELANPLKSLAHVLHVMAVARAVSSTCIEEGLSGISHTRHVHIMSVIVFVALSQQAVRAIDKKSFLSLANL